jgi:hypothetical protein
MRESRPQDHRALPEEDFRGERSYLADHVFAIAPGGDQPPTDPAPQEAWEHIMHLPTDVLLRTTDYLGTMVDDMHEQGSAWIFAWPSEVAKAPFMFDATLDASDEFQAAPFIAMHGWYRQATAGLRNALEGMALAAAFAVRGDAAGLRDWRDGITEPKFGNAVDMLAADPQLGALDQRLGSSGLFGRRPDGIVRGAYSNLCRYAHSRPGHTNVDIWQSNGPVFIPKAFTQFWIDFCDTVALSYVLLKIGWKDLELPNAARPLYGFADDRWNDLGSKVEAEFF